MAPPGDTSVTAATGVRLASGEQRPGTLLNIREAQDSPSPLKNDLAQGARNVKVRTLLGGQAAWVDSWPGHFLTSWWLVALRGRWPLSFWLPRDPQGEAHGTSKLETGSWFPRVSLPYIHTCTKCMCMCAQYASSRHRYNTRSVYSIYSTLFHRQ